jgi:hypothetical protein
MEKDSEQPQVTARRSGLELDHFTVGMFCIALAAIVWLAFGQTVEHQFINYDNDGLHLREPECSSRTNVHRNCPRFSFSNGGGISSKARVNLVSRGLFFCSGVVVL